MTTTKPATKPKAQSTPKTEGAKSTKPAKKAKAATGTITVLAKKNPHADGSNRHGWFAKLKTGMPVAEAVEREVPSVYLRRAAARGILKIGYEEN